MHNSEFGKGTPIDELHRRLIAVEYKLGHTKKVSIYDSQRVGELSAISAAINMLEKLLPEPCEFCGSDQCRKIKWSMCWECRTQQTAHITHKSATEYLLECDCSNKEA